MARGAGNSSRGRGRGRGGALEEAAIEQIGGLQPELVGTGAGNGLGVDPAGVAGGGAGLAGVGAGGHVGAVGPGALGAAAGVAQVPDGGLADLLRQLLERLPGVVPPQAPVVPPQAPVVPPVVAEVQPAAAVAGGVPSYIKMMEQLQKIGTGYFAGGPSSEEADSWRDRVERNFRSTRCPEEYRVDLAVHFLEKDAHLWWRSVIARRSQAEMTWVDFVREFNAKYFPQEALDRMEAQFLRLSQGERTVREYDQEFNKLLVYAGHGMEEDKTQMRKFLTGLNPDLRARCRGLNYTTKAGLVEVAAEIERDLQGEIVAASPAEQPKKAQQQVAPGRGGKPAQGRKRRWDHPSRGGQSGQSGQSGQGAQGGRGGCYSCGSLDHKIADCPRRVETRECYHCKEKGHLRPNCPKLQRTAVAAVQHGVQPGVQQQEVLQLAQIAAPPQGYTSFERGEPSTRAAITGKF